MKCKPIQDACQAYIQTNGFLRGMSQAAIGVIFAYPLFALLNSVAGTVVFAYFEAPAFYFFILSAGLLFASGNFIMLMAGLGAQAVVSLVAFIMAIVTSARWGGFGFSIVSALLELAVMGLLTLLSYKAYTFGRPSARPAAYMCPQCGGPVNAGAAFCPNCGARFQPPQPQQPAYQPPPQQAQIAHIPQQTIPQQAQIAHIPQQSAPPKQEAPQPQQEQAPQQNGKICPACNRQCAPNAKFCGGCGQSL